MWAGEVGVEGDGFLEEVFESAGVGFGDGREFGELSVDGIAGHAVGVVSCEEKEASAMFPLVF